MGGLCSRRATADSTTDGGILHLNGHLTYCAGIFYQLHGLSKQPNCDPTQSPAGESADKQLSEPVLSFPEVNVISRGVPMDDVDDGIPRLSRALSNKSRSTRSKQVAIAKVSEVSSLLGRAGTAGFGKAVDVLDTLGSSMTNLNLSSGFASSMATKGNKISILAFEVANTIVKGANLMHSLSKENVQHLKKVVLPSEGVQLLITKDTDELLRIAAADKRDELKIFSGEVVRFGNRCKDPQWHNLERYFEKLESELTPHKNLKEEAEAVMMQLMILVQYTAELYHEFHALDRFEQDYRRKAQEEDTSNATQRGDSLAILRAELKSQRKHVKSLKKKSLWSKILEEVTEKLVDIMHFLHLEIHAAFGCADEERPTKNTHQRLGSAGLALHYANIITQIDTLVTRSGSVPPNTRDALYHGLPPSIKSALRFKLLSFSLKEELTVPQIKGEMEKTLQWLVPMAANTTKSDIKPASQVDLLRIETLYHADKERTEAYILELVVWLHYLVSQSRSAANGGVRSPVKSPIHSPNQKTIQLSSHKPSSPSSPLTVEDREMLRDVSKRKLTPGISKSQEFADTGLSKYHRLSKSSSHSPINETRKNPFPIRRPSSVPVFDFDIDRMKALDVIDRVDTIRGA
ncbi:protein PSK SIMULATOR 1-like isoform X2 [Lycium ferocissimum]|uniref:protein PSK SIMULATOR 1-like isoform X2 n=1 Tax=Lycium ferocissimum TaxID=112874 RepID=UPI0028168DEC|nr:protein PSK SIMULATOR 1-like isoform X2 [Lycium ferocissimum]